LLLERMAETRTPIVRALGQGRAGTVAFGRFLSNDNVTMEEVFASAGAACGARAAGRRVLAIQDTTHLSFPGRALGPGGDGKVPGLFLHPVLVLDESDGELLGLAAGRVWTRGQEKVTSRHARALEDKESERWLGEGEAAKTALALAQHVTLIADRESDIYEEWARLPEPGFDLITRARGDRSLDDGGMLFAAAAEWPQAGRAEIDIVARKDRPARTATLELKFGTVTIKKPANCLAKDVPKTITLRLVEVAEINAPPDVEPVHWRLLTTRAVESVADGWAVVEDYRQRWRIEDYFRVLKRSGMNLEAAQLEGAHALHNLVAIGAVAGVPVMQLVEGRDAGPLRRASEVISSDMLIFATALCATLEGKTAKQKNPHEKGSLAWLAWIVARLGGWSGYQRYGPAGPKTMASGWDKFIMMQHGWNLRKNV
jgi:Transposase DDE domain